MSPSDIAEIPKLRLGDTPIRPSMRDRIALFHIAFNGEYPIHYSRRIHIDPPADALSQSVARQAHHD